MWAGRLLANRWMCWSFLGSHICEASPASAGLTQLCCTSFPSSRQTWAHAHDQGIEARRVKKHMGCLRCRPGKQAQCHFHLILLAKTNHWADPHSRDGGRTSPWEELHSCIAKVGTGRKWRRFLQSIYHREGASKEMPYQLLSRMISFATLASKWIYQKGFQRWSHALSLEGVISPQWKASNKFHGQRNIRWEKEKAPSSPDSNIFTYVVLFFPDQQGSDFCPRRLGPLFLSHASWVLAEWRWTECYWEIGKLTLFHYDLLTFLHPWLAHLVTLPLY